MPLLGGMSSTVEWMGALRASGGPDGRRLLDRLRIELRARHYSRRTDRAYVAWIRRYPKANRELSWQWVFPAARPYLDPVTRQRRHHHLHETVLQRAVRAAALAAGLAKRVCSVSALEPCGARWIGFEVTQIGAKAWAMRFAACARLLIQLGDVE
jgi:hypothetical protein